VTHDLLHLDSSARAGSLSRALSAAFADGWRRTHPEARHVHRDLVAEPVPPIGQGWTELCDAVLAAGVTDPRGWAALATTADRRAAWAVVEPLLAELLAADVVVLGVPMYNFGIPAALKAWIDQVTFPRMSLAGRSFVVAGARGGTYAPGTPRAPYDHHETYLRDVLAGHFAVDDVHFVHAELTNTRIDPALAHRADDHLASLAAAYARVDELVADLGDRRAA
jgi:FMN-dependent NADH-azoreductase